MLSLRQKSDFLFTFDVSIYNIVHFCVALSFFKSVFENLSFVVFLLWPQPVVAHLSSSNRTFYQVFSYDFLYPCLLLTVYKFFS